MNDDILWKDIPEYEGHYQASSDGQIRSLTKEVNSKGGSIAVKQGKILSQNTNSKGYCLVHLSKDGQAKTRSVHRLVASAFIENDNNFPCINHKDENPGNNSVDNLEWCSYEYNNNYGTRKEKDHDSRINGKMSKAFVQLDIEGNYIAEFPSAAEVKRSLGYDPGKIINVAKGKPKHKTAYGYVWKYKDNYSNNT